MSVNEKMTLLADAVRAKSGTTGPLSIDGMTTAVNSITVGSGIDGSPDTPVATLLNVTPSKSTAIYYPSEYNADYFSQVVVQPIPSEYIVTEDATATAADITKGKTAYVKGDLITGRGIMQSFYKCVESKLVSPLGAQRNIGDWYTLSASSGNAYGAFNNESVWVPNNDDNPPWLQISFKEKKKTSRYKIVFRDSKNFFTGDKIELYGITGTSTKVLLDTITSDDFPSGIESAGEIEREVYMAQGFAGYETYRLEFSFIISSIAIKSFMLFSEESKYWSGYKAYWDGEKYKFENNVTDRLIFDDGFSVPLPGRCYTAAETTEVNLSGIPWGSGTTAQASDVYKGLTVYINGEKVTGTMPDTAAVLDGNTVTVPAGRIREDVTVTIPMGRVLVGRDDLDDNVMVEGSYSNKVTITEGYHNDRTVTIGNAVTGYTITPSVNGQAILPGTYITGFPLLIEGDANLVPENIKKDVSIFGVPGAYTAGFELVKVMKYTAYRAELTAPEKVVFSGLGTVESEYGDSADFSDVNGTYTVTDDTKYLSGLKRVYKQEGGKYYLCGYDPSGEEFAEYSAHWYISTSIGGYGWNARMSCYSSAEIPNGAATWSNDMVGEFSVTTSVTNKTYPEQPLGLYGKTVNSYDETTGQWDCSESSTALSGCENPPEISQIFAIQNNRTIGNYIDWVGAFADECDERTLVYIPCDELKLRDRSVYRRTVNRLGDESHIALEKGVFGNCWRMEGEYPGGLCYVDIPEFDVNADWCFETYYYGANGGGCFAYIGSIGFSISTDYFEINGTRVIINDPWDGSFPVNKQLVHLAVQYNSQLKRIECFANGQMRTITQEGNEFIWENLPQAKKIIMGLDWTSQAYVHRWDEFRLHQYRKYTGDFTPPGFEEK